jgi:DNA-binding transcriptional LysR family regulator
MDLYQTMRAFAAVVDEGGFAPAARSLGVSPPAVTRYVQQLEIELGVQLLARSTRRVTPTDAGRAFYAASRRALDATAEALATVRGVGEELGGGLRVNAPMSFGTRHLAPMVAAFMARHPRLRIELALNDRFVDLIAEGFDVSIRIAQPEQTTALIARELAPARRVLCAAPEYLDRVGWPAAPEQLAAHRCLHYGYQQTGSRWRLKGPAGDRSYAVNCVFWSNNGEALRAAAVAGQGIALLPTFIVGGDLQEGGLLRVLPEYEVPMLSIHAVFPRHRHGSRNVDAFVTFVAEQMAGLPPWELVS